MLGINDTANFWEFGPFNAQPPFEPNDVFTDLMSRETAAKMGFNTLHVPTSARQAADARLTALGLSPEQADQLFGLGYPAHWSERARHRARIAGLPLVVDYSALHLFTMANLAERIAKAGFPPDLRHDGGFLPYIPELDIGRNIYETYFAGGAEYWLDDGNSNPWVYELFNEVQWYHSKHPLNRACFAEWLRRRYGDDLERLRAVWGRETPESFAAAERLAPWNGAAMKADWMLFLGDRFVEIFNDGKAAVQGVDPRRDNVYFDIEIAVHSLWYEQNGIDYHKLMKAADLFGTEGGMPFGVFADTGKSYLDDVMNQGKIKTMFAYDLARAFAGDKPVMNQEAYVKRMHAGLGIVPARRTDFPTLFWFEVFRGLSGSQVYCWWQGYKNNGWKSLDDARQTANRIPPALLNPYAYPFDSLKGFQDFRDELEPLADAVLPYPRAVRDVAILYSLPSVWRQPHAISGNQRFPYQQHCFAWYETFLQKQIPVAVLTEQELVERGPGAYKAIAVPYAAFGFDGVAERLRAFAEAGGTVLLGDGALRYDPYGRERQTPPLEGKNIHRIPAGLPAAEQSTALLRALAAGGYRAPFTVTGSDAAVLAETEVQVIRRDGMDLYFFCNWSGRTAGTVDFVPTAMPGDRLYVTDAAANVPVLSPSGKTEWLPAELAAGMPVAVPSQERVLVAVTRKPWPAAATAPARTFAAIRARAAEARKEVETRVAEYDAEVAERRRAEREAHAVARRPYPAVAAKCFPLSLEPAANMAFRDETAGDRRGGWTDQGSMDFREFPAGRFTYAGVPFAVVDPDVNGGKSCIVLKGTVPYFPERSGDIAVGRKAAALYFLHAAAWGGGTGHFLDYVITYEDGTTAVFPILGGRECADWAAPKALTDGVIAWEGKKPNGMDICAYAARWTNPAPDKPIRSVQAVSAGLEAVPIVIAITAEET